jgi:pimeloyl-ACP methyl ester carboxylesterase
MFEDITLNRRHSPGTTAMTIAQPGMIGSADAQSRNTDPPEGTTTQTGTNTSFDSLKQIDAGVLNVGYAEAGPSDGPAVILLHGWPYDIHSYVDVAPMLAEAGYRTIVPYLRGYGTTRFLASETLRNGQQSVLAVDIVALMDALKIEKAVLGGYDWGARTANVIAALWPERCKALLSVSGYLIGSPEANKMPLPPKAELQWWYQFYFATERGLLGYDKYRHDFAKLIWQSLEHGNVHQVEPAGTRQLLLCEADFACIGFSEVGLPLYGVLGSSASACGRSEWPTLSGSPARWRKNPSAIWLLAEFCVRRNNTFCFRIATFLLRSPAPLAPDP